MDYDPNAEETEADAIRSEAIRRRKIQVQAKMAQEKRCKQEDTKPRSRIIGLFFNHSFNSYILAATFLYGFFGQDLYRFLPHDVIFVLAPLALIFTHLNFDYLGPDRAESLLDIVILYLIVSFLIMLGLSAVSLLGIFSSNLFSEGW